MTRVVTSHSVDAEGLAVLRAERRDLVVEESSGDDAWAQVEGPFSRYERRLDVAQHNGGYEVVEKIDFRLATPVWRPLISPLMRRALASAEREPRRRWWWPKQVVPRPTATLVSTLCVLSVMTGYMGVIIGQTITFAARDFGAGDASEANALAITRVGVLLSLLLIPRADRIGRRPMIIAFAGGAIFFTVIGAAAPSLFWLGSAQTISRGLTTGLITLLVLGVTEQVPAEVRAFSISLITISAALGAGMVLWVLPVDDLIDEGWRIVYLVPLLFIPLLWLVARHLPETRRFGAAVEHHAPAEIDWSRFVLLGATAFIFALFVSPASQLRNEFLRDDLGYSAADISVFQLVISAPAGTAILLSGLAADRFGRRWIGAVGIAVGSTMMALSFQLVGAGLWIAASVGVVATGAAFPATRGYSTELFPTRARAKVGGMLDVVGVTGSAVGLVTVGYLAERWDDLGSAIGVMLVGPLIVGVLIITRFPETARSELERFNPKDPEVTEI